MNLKELKEYVQAKVGSIANYVIISHCTSKGGSDSVEGRAVDAGEPAYSIYARRIWPFGIRSVPPKGCEAIILRINGGRRNVVLIGAESMQLGPTDLAEGETAIYCKINGSLVKLDQQGNLAINSGTPQGGAQADVVVNAGTAAVSRVGDETDSGMLTSQVTQVPGPPPVTTVLILYTDQLGTTTPLLTMVFTAGLLTATTPLVGAIVNVPVKGKPVTGAPHFKA